MSVYADKLMKGETPTDEDWAQHLIEAHRESPSMTPEGFLPLLTREGLTSYARLAAELPLGARTVVDLACGDGILAGEILPRLDSLGKLTGVDMADSPLALARAKFPQAQFVCARADDLPFADGSVDAVLCHMAFMLMRPVEPVVDELRRVLRGGGVFLALLPPARSARDGYFGEIRSVIGAFISERFPGFRKAVSGDPRVYTLEGLRELFAVGFEPVDEPVPCPLVVRADAAGVWDFMKDTYFIGMLPAADKADLKARLMDFVGSGLVKFEFPTQLLTVRRATANT